MSKSRLRSRAKVHANIPGNGSASDGLRDLLVGFAPTVDKERLDISLQKIFRAAEIYRRSFSEVVEGGHRRKPGKNTTSAALSSFEKKVGLLPKEDLFEELSKLPLSALRMFSREYGPRGKLLREPGEVSTSINVAMNKSAATKDNPPDNDRIYLAYVIGVELSSLGIRPSLSESDGRITGQKNGAAWARIVNQSLEVAGIKNARISKKQLKQAMGLIAELD